MNGDSSTAPTRPPPGPPIPGLGELASISPQHEDVSLAPASSNRTTSRPSRRYAGEAMIRGTHLRRNLSAVTRPPGRPSGHGESWPSSHTSGVMNEKLGVVLTCLSAEDIALKLITCESQ